MYIYIYILQYVRSQHITITPHTPSEKAINFQMEYFVVDVVAVLVV